MPVGLFSMRSMQPWLSWYLWRRCGAGWRRAWGGGEGGGVGDGKGRGTEDGKERARQVDEGQGGGGGDGGGAARRAGQAAYSMRVHETHSSR